MANMGRPPKDVDERLLVELARIHCTHEEIASILGISPDTLTRRFAEVIKAARDEGKMSLRRKMWQLALDGNTTMLVWISKNELGYSDKSEQRQTIEVKALPPEEVNQVLLADPFDKPEGSR